MAGFGYKQRRMTPLFNQVWLAQFMPKQTYDYVSLQGWNKCMQEQPNQNTPAITIETDEVTNAVTLPARVPEDFPQVDVTALQVDIAELKEQITQQFTQLYSELSQQHTQIVAVCQAGSVEWAIFPALDPNEQKKAELQAQIEQLQAEMGSL